MKSPTVLEQRIREEFSNVAFPVHCGLHAAVAMDDWIEDKEVLRKITEEKDVKGEWWDVPIVHLTSCMMALSYFDAAAMEFYLPAYMSAVVCNPTEFDVPRVKSSSWQVVHALLPDEEDEELIQHFKKQFRNIRGGKKRACKEFLKCMAASKQHNEHAREIAEKALNHEFWLCSS